MVMFQKGLHNLRIITKVALSLSANFSDMSDESVFLANCLFLRQVTSMSGHDSVAGTHTIYYCDIYLSNDNAILPDGCSCSGGSNNTTSNISNRLSSLS